MDAITKGTTVVLVDVLEYSQELLQAVGKAGGWYNADAQATEDTVWWMARELGQLRNKHSTLDAVVRGGALGASFSSSSITNNACSFLECIAQRLEWAQSNAHGVWALAKQLQPHDTKVFTFALLVEPTQAATLASFWRLLGLLLG
jgi:hypothetical protein